MSTPGARMTPMSLRVGVMDSQRPGTIVTVPVEVLALSTRVVRGLKRMALVSVIGVCIVPVPLLHLCGVVVALIVGPIAGVFAFQAKALLGACDVPCAKCNEPLAIPERHPGWPARVHCVKCGAMVEFNPA